MTGNPVRAEILARGDRPRPRHGAAPRSGVEPAGRVVAVFAGSLGATSINQAVDRVWSSGGGDAVRPPRPPRARAPRLGSASSVPTPPPDGIHYHPVRYEDRMDRVLAAADVAVCRAGGTTVAELAVVGVPSVLVPLPDRSP